MRVFVLILLVFVAVPGAGGAVVLPPDVLVLQRKLAAAEGQLAAVQRQLEAARRQKAATDGKLRQLVKAVLRAQGYPAGFWVARSVVTDTPEVPTLMGVVARQSAAELARTQQQASRLAALYGEVNAQLAAVREVESVYDDARGRLVAAERDVLHRAGVQADALGEQMAAALSTTATTVVPVSDVVPVAEVKAPVATPAASAGPVSRLPVAGRVEKPFHTADGAMSEGVVLRAAAGGMVRTPKAATVLYAGPFRQFGGLVILKTDDGRDMVLGGLETLHVSAGMALAAGQVVGKLGDTGRLYWEVRRRGRVVDPLG